MHVGGPLAGKPGLEKSSSDGLVKDELIWQQRALMSPSPGNPISISNTSKKGRQGETRGAGVAGGRERRKKEGDINSFVDRT